MTQRSVKEMVEWYRTHETTSQLGFNPDGMCLKICRMSRNIGPMYPTALTASLATPSEHRIHDVYKIKQGHFVYYDDPNDDNPYGHIAGVVGRDRERDPNTLGSLWVRTNSVVSGKVVVVRGDYFQRFWGDGFQFGASWLNGVPLLMPTPTPKPPLRKKGRARLEAVIEELDAMIENHQRAGHTRLVRALKRDRAALKETLATFSK